MISQINPNVKDSMYETMRDAINIEIVMHILKKIFFNKWCISPAVPSSIVNIINTRANECIM